MKWSFCSVPYYCTCIVHILLDCPHDDVLVHLLTQLRHPLHDSQEDGERDSGLILRVGLPHYFGQGLICGTFLYVLKTTLKLHFPLYTWYWNPHHSYSCLHLAAMIKIMLISVDSSVSNSVAWWTASRPRLCPARGRPPGSPRSGRRSATVLTGDPGYRQQTGHRPHPHRVRRAQHQLHPVRSAAVTLDSLDQFGVLLEAFCV